MHRHKYILSSIAISWFISANANAVILNAPQVSSGYSEVRTEGGATCRSSHAGNLQVYGGVYGDTEKNPYNYYGTGEDKGAYVGINISIGGGKILDCSKLYELETTRAQLELERLKSEIAQLKKLQALQELNIPLPLNHK